LATYLVAVSTVAAGCGGTSSVSGDSPAVTDDSGLPVDRPVTRSPLRRLAVAHLRFPGSVLVKAVGMDQTPTRSGEEPNPAFTGGIFAAFTTPAGLYAWYGSAIEHAGFAPAPDFRPADQVSGQAWEIHHRLELEVGVFDPSLLREDTGVVVDLKRGQLAYEAVVVGYPPGLPRY
jgi:hypothetical protein